MPASPYDASTGPQSRPALSEDPPRTEIVTDHLEGPARGITVLRPAQAPAIRFTGSMAPENNTAGKHNIGRASVA